MSQFRPLQLIQQVETIDLTEVQFEHNPVTPSPTQTTPLILFTQQPTATTAPLTDISGLQAMTSTTGRILRIPGSRKRSPITEELPRRGSVMSTRLRHIIVLVSILLVAMTTLLSLAPLDNGQSVAFPLFRGITDWVHAQQANWQFQAHYQATSTPAAQAASQGQLPAPPAVVSPTSAYVAIAQQDAINAGISPDYFVRQINLESGFNPNAYSPSGAEGIAQFMPGTAAGLGINPWDPNQALNAAAHVMAGYNRNYSGDYAMALAAYNGGSGTVQYAVNACGAANWMNCLPGETRNYIRVIMGI